MLLAATVASASVVAAQIPGDTSPIDSGVVRVCAGGDVTLGTNLDTTWAKKTSKQMRRRIALYPRLDSLLDPVRPLFQDADVVLVNVEGAIGEGKAKSKCGPRSESCFAFRMPVGAAAAIRALSAAPVVGNVANNHANDAGPKGVIQTLERLTAAGVLITGADSEPTLVVTASGDTVAVLGFGTSGFPDARDLDAVSRWVSRAAARYRRVIVTMHLGNEGIDAQRTADTTEHLLDADRGNPLRFARTAVDAGASLVIGHGPHVIRGLEWRDHSLIAYSLGNLVTYGPFSLREPNNRAGVLCVSLDSAGVPFDIVLRPTRQRRPGLVSVDPSRRSVTLADSLSLLDFPLTGAEFRLDGSIVPMVLPVAPAPP
jgi:poly-gamma-glutamate capsule biosynthesis protein CapA/YwtB (metallophosphatase superfamily)